MKSVFFPFTTLDPRLAERLSAEWGPITLLQPSEDTVQPITRRLERAGCVDLLLPPRVLPDGGLQETLEAYERWAVQNAGSDRDALLEQSHRIPFFERQFAAQLAADIRKGGRSPEETPETTERRALLQAQLFLAMAQKLDCQQAEVARDIAVLAAKEKEMLALLKGENGIAQTFAPAYGSPAAGKATAMLELRLKAWARVMTAAKVNDAAVVEADCLFLTDAPDLPAHLEEIFPEMAYRLRCRNPADEKTPRQNRVRLPDGLAGKGLLGAEAPGLDLIEIPATAPSAFLARLAGRPLSLPAAAIADAPVSTWIGCLPPPHDPVGASSEEQHDDL